MYFSSCPKFCIYFTLCLKRDIYFYFLFFFLKFESQSKLSIDAVFNMVKETSEGRRHKLKRQLMIKFCFEGQ